MPSCEICGTKKEEFLFRVKVEGTEVKCCKACSKYGKVIATPEDMMKQEGKAKHEPEVYIKPEIEESIVRDFGEKIKNVREKSGLMQEEFAKKYSLKLSTLKGMEQGKMIPELKLAKRLQTELNVLLIEEQAEVRGAVDFKKSDGIILGDMIKIRKRKN